MQRRLGHSRWNLGKLSFWCCTAFGLAWSSCPETAAGRSFRRSSRSRKGLRLNIGVLKEDHAQRRKLAREAAIEHATYLSGSART
mmetsp:Transcript_33162/g.73965  ORF Transcript_33162/g.73965 Transcript_33162/m.73965 type:complete len:85 (-) Transcript_33162:1100-1354(-)